MTAAIDATVWVDLCPSPAAAIDAEGRVVAANDAMARCLDCSPRQLLSTELATWAADPAALRGFLGRRDSVPRDFRLRARDGSERWLEITLGAHTGAGARLLSAFDVTARRAEREKLAEESRRFRDIVGVGGGTLYEMNAELTRIRLWERDPASGAVKIDERHAKFPDDVIDPSFNPMGLAETQRRYAAREPVRNLIYRVANAPTEVYRMGNSVPFYDADGVYQGRRGVSIDVTAQVLAERALRQNEALLRRAREHLEHAQRVAATGSSERDIETGALEWSEEMYRLAGEERASFELTDANIFGLVHEDDRERLKAIVIAGRNGVSPPPAEFRIRRRDGEVRTLYCETDVIRDQAGKPVRVLTVFKDVTELRAAQKRQEGIEQQLLQAQKLEAMGTLAGGVAHELNNTLVPVLGLAKLTLRRLPQASRERDNLGLILAAAEKARDLVQRIVAFSRSELPTRAPVDLADLARQALSRARQTLPPHIAIEERIAAVPLLDGDRAHLHQVVSHLVSNAVQAITGRPGTVTVEVAPTLGAQLPHMPEHASLPVIRLSVADDGCGMDKATMARIFEPFFTTKAVGVGTGLGLSVVHGIVTQHGGRIVVESEVGRGTRVDVYLPAAEGAGATEAERRRAGARRCPAGTLG